VIEQDMRPKAAAAFFPMPFSSFNRARYDDPDFARLKKGIPIGLRAIIFTYDDCLWVKLIKECRRDGIADDKLEAEVERRFIAKKAQNVRIAEEAKKLSAAKPKSKEVHNGTRTTAP